MSHSIVFLCALSHLSLLVCVFCSVWQTSSVPPTTPAFKQLLYYAEKLQQNNNNKEPSRMEITALPNANPTNINNISIYISTTCHFDNIQDLVESQTHTTPAQTPTKGDSSLQILSTPFFEPKNMNFALSTLCFFLPPSQLLSCRYTFSMGSTGYKEISQACFDCRRVPGIVVLCGMFEGACHAAFWLRHAYPLLSPRKITPSKDFPTLKIHKRGLSVVHGSGTSGTVAWESLGGRCRKKQ